MEQPQNEKKFTLAIARIKDLEFYINENADIDENFTSQVTFNNTLNVFLEQELLDFIIEVSFYVDDIKNTFMRGKVQTSFQIQDMKQYLVPGTTQVDIPDQALATMLSIAITHTRALIAKASMGSRYNNLYVPIILNINDMVKLLLGNPKTN